MNWQQQQIGCVKKHESKSHQNLSLFQLSETVKQDGGKLFDRFQPGFNHATNPKIS